MNRYILLVSMFLSTYVGMAQKGKISVDYAYGLNIPVGDFRDVNSQNNNAGYAKTGLSSHMSIKYQFASNGLSALLSIDNQANPFDVAGYDKELTLLTPGSNWSIVSDVYTMGGYYLGLQKEFKQNSKWSFDVFGQFGIAYGKDPGRSSMELNSLVWLVSSVNYSTAFAIKFGAQAKYEFAERFYLTFNANYIGSKQEFEDTELFISDGDYMTYDNTLDFNSFSLKIGLSADLYK